MAIFHPPTPATFVGGAQPYAMRQGLREESAQTVNDPPFRYGGPYVAISLSASVSQPDPWVYAFMGNLQPFEARKLPVDITAVPENDPPFQHPSRTPGQSAIALWPWLPDPWTWVYGDPGPYLPKKLSPGIPGQSADPPPFEHRARTFAYAAQVAAVWQPDPWIYSPPGGRQPYEPRKLPPSLSAVPEDNPPFDMRRVVTMMELTATWNIPWPPMPQKKVPSAVPYLVRRFAQGYILGG